MSSSTSTTVSFHNNVTHKRRAKNPSFSSILLDAIYQSIDEDHHHHNYPHTTPTSPTRNVKQKSERNYGVMDIDDNQPSKQEVLPRSRTKMRSDCTLETVDLRRAIMIESWMEKQQQRQQQQQQQQQRHKHSSSSSSSTYSAQQQQQQRKHHFHLGDILVRQKSVPNRTRVVVSSSDNSTVRDFSSSSSSSSCFTNLASARDQSSSRIFTKTKSRALKIYGDLKRSKPPHQNTPISPGRRIAAFLNSIFRNSGNSSARSSPSPSPEIKLNPPPIMSNSTCSSASSFSRSCLSKTTNTTTTTSSSTTKSSSTPGTTTKRSVRFYPVSVIVDEDSKPCGHKSLQKIENEDSKKRENEIDALMMMMKTNCNNSSKNTNNNNSNNNQTRVSSFGEDMMNVDDEEQIEDEEEDDGESCASSDLFELENLSSIGDSRYYEELPVYGTTSLKNITA